MWLWTPVTQGNLGWAYMQLGNHMAAEVVYRKAQSIDPDANKACNLCLCLIKQSRYDEARTCLEDVLQGKVSGSEDPKSRNRAEELLQELEKYQSAPSTPNLSRSSIQDACIEGLEQLMNQWAPIRTRRLPIFEEISPFRDQLACWFELLSAPFVNVCPWEKPPSGLIHLDLGCQLCNICEHSLESNCIFYSRRSL